MIITFILIYWIAIANNLVIPPAVLVISIGILVYRIFRFIWTLDKVHELMMEDDAPTYK